MAHQTFIVRLDADLARRVRRFLGSGGHGYSSIDELVEVALLNQLGAEGVSLGEPCSPQTVTDEPVRALGAEPRHTSRNAPKDSFRDPFPDFLPALLRRPAPTPPAEVAPEVDPGDGSLFVFTNRLSPIKVATRVLANLAHTGEWPLLGPFREAASEVARSLGLRLRHAEEAGADTSGRRWVAYPIGSDSDKAKGRYVTSFTIGVGPEGEPTGPMALLGLAALVDGRVVLTRAGWRLATAPSPLIDGIPGATLSAPEAEILHSQIRRAPRERAAVEEFLRAVELSGGRQQHIDEILQEAHSEWTRDLTIAQRSAMLGRLADLRILEVTGRGPGAIVKLLPGLSGSQSSATEAL